MAPKASAKLSSWQVLLSVLAAFLGVQSETARRRDFEHGRPWMYIGVGILLTCCLIGTLWGIVRLVLHS